MSFCLKPLVGLASKPQRSPRAAYRKEPKMSMTNSRSAGSLVSRAWEMPSDASRSSMDQLRAKKTAEHAALKQLVSLRREVQDLSLIHI